MSDKPLELSAPQLIVFISHHSRKMDLSMLRKLQKNGNGQTPNFYALRLEDKSSNYHVVTNTTGESPYHVKGIDIKEGEAFQQQVERIVAWCKENGPALRPVLVGDFNFDSGSEVSKKFITICNAINAARVIGFSNTEAFFEGSGKDKQPSSKTLSEISLQLKPDVDLSLGGSKQWFKTLKDYLTAAPSLMVEGALSPKAATNTGGAPASNEGQAGEGRASLAQSQQNFFHLADAPKPDQPSKAAPCPNGQPIPGAT